MNTEFDLNRLESVNCMDSIKNEHRPVFIYGMGNGALKILEAFGNNGIEIEGIFASDEFVRGHSFCGYTVQKLCDVEEKYDDFVIVLAFAAGYESLIAKIRNLANRHKLYAPDVPLFFDGKMRLFDYSYVEDNLEQIKTAYKLLHDEKSREVFYDILNFKITGNIDFLFNNQSERREITSLLEIGNNETFVDCGAYKGDTAEEFLRLCSGEFSHIYALEPDRKNFKKLNEKFGEIKNIDLYQACVWDADGLVPFSSKSGRQSSVSSHNDGTFIEAFSVDSIVGKDQVTYIKYDIEGAEKRALAGSKRVIAKHKPKLLVSLYHRNEDIFELPIYIHSLNPNYKMLLRHEPYIPAWDTQLICL